MKNEYVFSPLLYILLSVFFVASCATHGEKHSTRHIAVADGEPLLERRGPVISESQNDAGFVMGNNLHRAVVSRALNGKQNFVDTAQSFFSYSGKLNLEDAAQPLGRPFSRAYDFRERINHCHAFIDKYGEYGPWGELITRTLEIPEISAQLIALSAADKAGMADVCPNFRNLSVDARVEFWVWVMASLALFESTCGFDTTNPGNPNAVGIYQLHRSERDRRPRALIESGICGVYDSQQISENEKNIKCTLDFIRDGFSGRLDEIGPAGLVTRAQQFEKLRRSNTSLVNLIKQFESCQIPLQETY